MVTAFDKEFKATKRIKQGKASLSAPFDELARWIATTWQVTVLNVIYAATSPPHTRSQWESAFASWRLYSALSEFRHILRSFFIWKPGNQETRRASWLPGFLMEPLWVAALPRCVYALKSHPTKQTDTVA